MTLRSLALLALIVPSVAFARPPGLERGGEREHSPEQRIEHMTEALNLSEAQVTAIRAVMEEAHTAGSEIRDQMRSAMEGLRAARESGDDKAIKSALKEVERARQDAHAQREDTRAAITAELTAEQQAAFAVLELRHRGGHGDREGAACDGPERPEPPARPERPEPRDRF